MTSMDFQLAATRWDDEYRQGRYAGERPLPFVSQVVSILADHPSAAVKPGLYVGCGNGRNLLPLVDAGLDLYGLDISAEAVKLLGDQRPTIAPRLTCGDFRAYHADQPFGYIVAIQVFQHGTFSDAETYFRKTTDLLMSGGLLFVRVNSIATQIYQAHTVIESTPLGGTTIRYEEGPKRGLLIHFYSLDELTALSHTTLRPIIAPQERLIKRAAPKTGHWAQWEAIWQKA